MDAELLVDLRSEIGEGPLWDHRSGRLLFIDVVAGELFSATLDGRVEILGMGHALGAVGLRAEGGYVLATQHGVSTLEPGGKPEPFSDLRLAEGMRMNDAQVGPEGNLWAGSMSWDARPGAGSLYRISPDGSWRVVLESLTVSNGIGWNAAGDTMYYVDSVTHRLEAFDREPNGSISGRRVLAEVPEGLPDGLCVDEEDHVWLAVYGSGAVVRFAPTGERVATVRVPATQATSCCFAGENLDVLVITSAGEGLTPVERHDQHAGAIFAADVGVRGRRANAFG